jgi:hypothetical protein
MNTGTAAVTGALLVAALAGMATDFGAGVVTRGEHPKTRVAHSQSVGSSLIRWRARRR